VRLLDVEIDKNFSTVPLFFPMALDL
jgi:hypothetical protein